MKPAAWLDVALLLALVGAVVIGAQAVRLPKPTPNCPDCRDATLPVAVVKEDP